MPPVCVGALVRACVRGQIDSFELVRATRPARESGASVRGRGLSVERACG